MDRFWFRSFSNGFGFDFFRFFKSVGFGFFSTFFGFGFGFLHQIVYKNGRFVQNLNKYYGLKQFLLFFKEIRWKNMKILNFHTNGNKNFSFGFFRLFSVFSPSVSVSVFGRSVSVLVSTFFGFSKVSVSVRFRLFSVSVSVLVSVS